MKHWPIRLRATEKEFGGRNIRRIVLCVLPVFAFFSAAWQVRAQSPPPVTIIDNETITLKDTEAISDVAGSENITEHDVVTVIAVNPPIDVTAPVAFFTPSVSALIMGLAVKPWKSQTSGQVQRHSSQSTHFRRLLAPEAQLLQSRNPRALPALRLSQ